MTIILQQLLLPVVVACHFRLFQVSALDLEHEHLSAVAKIQLLNFKMQTAVKFHVLYVTYMYVLYHIYDLCHVTNMSVQTVYTYNLNPLSQTHIHKYTHTHNHAHTHTHTHTHVLRFVSDIIIYKPP